jgi:hypothetical protein
MLGFAAMDLAIATLLAAVIAAVARASWNLFPPVLIGMTCLWGALGLLFASGMDRRGAEPPSPASNDSRPALAFASGKFEMTPAPGWSPTKGIDPQAALQLIHDATAGFLLLYAAEKAKTSASADLEACLDGALQLLRAKGALKEWSAREQLQVNGLRAARVSVSGAVKGEDLVGFFAALDAPGHVLLAAAFARPGQPRARAELERMVLSIRSR